MTDTKEILTVQNLDVTFARSAMKAVAGVSLSLGQGKVGIVGESGSGKSTLGRAIMRLLPPSATVTASKLTFDGNPLLSQSEREMRALRGNRMSLIMQDPRYSLNPVLPIGRQVAETAILHKGLSKSAARAVAAEMLDRVRIKDVARVMESYPHQISGGMGQRVMIAAMLLSRPRLVIADEPTSALDVSVRGEVLELLNELVTADGSSLLLISHDIRMVASFCDRIVVMYKGRIVEELSRLSDARHPYTLGLIAAMPDARHPVHRLRVPDRATFDATERSGSPA
ncbi:ABC transporter ATP-binding protein [Paracoccus aestuariivivens]|uniref:ATP-binding cassette domain-containing protein n=1 Tax=Paracoccus aestuariivivens TaxID=1820333 RepID=A0A6L6JI49_9RHOB|nr:ABC transporter ATP-binding protein [Paracoccus aestuariivivens]MTH79561.1 ATP-binding cassette domain-containing protein [Paracoccus aestuariivivens]